MTVQLQYLFDDIAYAALTAAEGGDICGDMPDLRGCVGRGACEADVLHGAIVRDIVTHVKHVFFVQLMSPGIFFQDSYLIMDIQIDIVDTQVEEPLAYAFVAAAGDNQDAVAFFQGELEGISVTGAHPAYLFTVCEDEYAAVCHDPIYVKNKCPDRFKFFKYAHIVFSLTKLPIREIRLSLCSS